MPRVGSSAGSRCRPTAPPPWSAAYGDNKGAVERIDASERGDQPGARRSGRPGPGDVVIDDDMSAVSGLDQSWHAHELVLGSGQSIPLGRASNVVALDATRQTALIDGQTLCTPGLGAGSCLPPPVSDRVVDMTTGRTLLDLGSMLHLGRHLRPDRCGRAAGPGRGPRRQRNNGLHVYDLRTGTEIGDVHAARRGCSCASPSHRTPSASGHDDHGSAGRPRPGQAAASPRIPTMPSPGR